MPEPRHFGIRFPNVGPRRLGFSEWVPGVSLPLSFDFSQSSGLPPGWVASAGAISGGKLVITPTKGANLVTNGTFAAWTADNPDGWGVFETVTENPAGECQIISAGPTAGITQNILTLGKWYELSLNCTAHASGSLLATDWSNNVIIGAVSAVQGYVGTGFRVNATDGRLFIKRAAACDVTIDDVVCNLLTDADMYAYFNTPMDNVGTVKASWVLSPNRRGGVVGWWDKAAPLANCLLAYHDGNSYCTLVKYVGTTPTLVVDSISTNYSAGASVEIRRTAATTFQLWYNGSQVGTDQTISDAEIINNRYFGVFGTSADSQCAAFYLNP